MKGKRAFNIFNDDLKIAKKSAGRYKDLDDLEHLP